MLLYNLQSFSDAEEFLSLLARKMGRLKKGGVPDVNAAGRRVLYDWNWYIINFILHSLKCFLDMITIFHCLRWDWNLYSLHLSWCIPVNIFSFKVWSKTRKVYSHIVNFQSLSINFRTKFFSQIKEIWKIFTDISEMITLVIFPHFSGKIRYFVEPPEEHPSLAQGENRILSELSAEFDVEKIYARDANVIQGW